MSPDTTGTMGLTTPVESLANQKERVTLEFSLQAISATTTLLNTFLSEVDCRAGTNHLKTTLVMVLIGLKLDLKVILFLILVQPYP